MHQGTQQQEAERQPAQRASDVGAVLDNQVERGQAEKRPEDPAA
jgi:hypothetical protein